MLTFSHLFKQHWTTIIDVAVNIGLVQWYVLCKNNTEAFLWEETFDLHDPLKPQLENSDEDIPPYNINRHIRQTPSVTLWEIIRNRRPSHLVQTESILINNPCVKEVAKEAIAFFLLYTLNVIFKAHQRTGQDTQDFLTL